jgi:hypothetical protein
VAGIVRASGACDENAPGGFTGRSFCRAAPDVDTAASGGIAGAHAGARAYRSYATARTISAGSFCISAFRFRIGDGSYAVAAVRGAAAAS